MAQEYKFQYELVEYKWPRWLHQQTEKQRTIWGYKILFLDVLFPLDVKKIIFVDADQVVRADMKELVDLDLGGAPYAYTPFCESRKEMDGFRLVLSKNNIKFYFKMHCYLKILETRLLENSSTRPSLSYQCIVCGRFETF